MNHKVGIIGGGFVGTAAEEGFQHIAEVRMHDKYKPSESLKTVVDNSDIVFFCLPTPMREDGSCDTSIIEQVACEANNIAKERKVFVIKSTVPPGTTQRIANLHFNHDWVFCPEFLTEANFIDDFLQQDRIVLGYTSNCSFEGKTKLRNLFIDFQTWQENEFDVVDYSEIYDLKSEEAEMVKYMGNCFLATKVIFANEIKEICDAANIDYNKVKNVVSEDMRIGPSHFDVPGSDGMHGYSGSCLPKDLNSLIFFAEQLGADPMVLSTIWTKNLLVREDYDWENLAQVTGEYDKDE